MSLHSDTLFWFRGNQTLLFRLNAACLANGEKKYIFRSLLFDPTAAPTPRSTALEESTLTILRHQCGSEKYMNKYFEYMTGYIVLILKAYIKMGVFLNGTTVGNFTLE
jgi:hypothetical protein